MQRALHRPDRVAVEVLVDEAEVVEVEAEMERRHPDDGDAAQRVEPVEAGPRAAARGRVERRRTAACARRSRRRGAGLGRSCVGRDEPGRLGRAAGLAAPARALASARAGQRAQQRPGRARQPGPHRDVREGRGDAQPPREAAAPERLVARAARAPAPRRRRAGSSSCARSARCAAASTKADCSAMLMPSPTIGCASPAALPTRKTPSPLRRAARRAAAGRSPATRLRAPRRRSAAATPRALARAASPRRRRRRARPAARRAAA